MPPSAPDLAAALHECEARYRTLFASLGEGLCVVEVLFDDAGKPVDYRFLEVNAAFVEQTGLQNAVGRRMRELAPDLEEYWFERYGHVALTGEPVRFEAAAEALGRYYEVYALRIGRPEQHQVAVRFVDRRAAREAERERDRLLAALELERARLAHVFQQAPSFLAVLRGPRHVFERVNEAYYHLVGHRELIGRPAFEALPEVADQGFKQLLDRVLATGEPFIGREMPLRVARTPGAEPEERFADLAYMPLVEADGTRSGVIAHGTDVTAHVLARREVERARDAAEAAWARSERLQALTTALAAARTLDDVATVVVSEMVVALGARTGALAVQARDETGDLMLVRHVGFTPEVTARLERQRVDSRGPVPECFRTGKPVWIESRDHDGAFDARYADLVGVWETLGVSAAAYLPLVVAGETVGVISFGFARPRTFEPADRAFLLALGQQAGVAVERARLFEAERVARADAEAAKSRAEHAGREADRANQAKSGFLATMSHELRTPINAMIGYTQLLQLGIAGPLTEQQRGYLERLAVSSQHLLGLVDDVLDLSKIEAGETRVARRDAWTGPAVQAALDLVRPQASAKSISLVDARPDALGVPYVGDEGRVRQIVLNLLSNAVKFTSTGGTVTVTCEMATDSAETGLEGSGPWAFVRVEDTGVGIPEDEVGRIFEPFHQVDRGHTRRQGGTGLGLAISRRLARLMGGDLTVASTPGVGSTFTLWLPVAHASPASETRPEDPAPVRTVGTEDALEAIVTPGLGAVGERLRDGLVDVLTRYVGRLREDPAIPQAETLSDSELEDHAASLLSDVAQSLIAVDGAGAAALELLRDGSTIQRVIADAHGARRRMQGFDETALRRDHDIMRAELTRAIRARGALETADVEDALRVLLSLIDRAEVISLNSWRNSSRVVRQAVIETAER